MPVLNILLTAIRLAQRELATDIINNMQKVAQERDSATTERDRRELEAELIAYQRQLEAMVRPGPAGEAASLVQEGRPEDAVSLIDRYLALVSELHTPGHLGNVGLTKRPETEGLRRA